MSEPVDQEIEAIKAVLAALTPLSEKARLSVLDYVSKRLDLTPQPALNPRGTLPPATPGPPALGGQPQPIPHIKDFKEQRHPRSANEMAALVAYYLANVAPEGQRKATINHKDINTHFKIAGFPLPRQIRYTLPNAKAAGYFDLVGEGEYRLNAVGHNLVAHSMPRGEPAEARPAKPRTRQKRQLINPKRSKK